LRALKYHDTNIRQYLSAYADGIKGSGVGTVSNCFNTGVVSASINSSASQNPSNNHEACAGGISGFVGGVGVDTTNCYSMGHISAFSNLNARAGGIIGSNGGPISTCYNIGCISAISPKSNAGGIRGYDGYNANVTNCYATNLYGN